MSECSLMFVRNLQSLLDYSDGDDIAETFGLNFQASLAVAWLEINFLVELVHCLGYPDY